MDKRKITAVYIGTKEVQMVNHPDLTKTEQLCLDVMRYAAFSVYASQLTKTEIIATLMRLFGRDTVNKMIKVIQEE